MTGRVIVFEIVLPTAFAIGLGILLSIGANYLFGVLFDFLS